MATRLRSQSESSDVKYTTYGALPKLNGWKHVKRKAPVKSSHQNGKLRKLTVTESKEYPLRFSHNSKEKCSVVSERKRDSKSNLNSQKKCSLTQNAIGTKTRAATDRTKVLIGGLNQESVHFSASDEPKYTESGGDQSKSDAYGSINRAHGVNGVNVGQLPEAPRKNNQKETDMAYVEKKIIAKYVDPQMSVVVSLCDALKNNVAEEKNYTSHPQNGFLPHPELDEDDLPLSFVLQEMVHKAASPIPLEIDSNSQNITDVECLSIPSLSNEHATSSQTCEPTFCSSAGQNTCTAGSSSRSSNSDCEIYPLTNGKCMDHHNIHEPPCLYASREALEATDCFTSNDEKVKTVCRSSSNSLGGNSEIYKDCHLSTAYEMTAICSNSSICSCKNQHDSSFSDDFTTVHKLDRNTCPDSRIFLKRKHGRLKCSGEILGRSCTENCVLCPCSHEDTDTTRSQPNSTISHQFHIEENSFNYGNSCFEVELLCHTTQLKGHPCVCLHCNFQIIPVSQRVSSGGAWRSYIESLGSELVLKSTQRHCIPFEDLCHLQNFYSSNLSQCPDSIREVLLNHELETAFDILISPDSVLPKSMRSSPQIIRNRRLSSESLDSEDGAFQCKWDQCRLCFKSGDHLTKHARRTHLSPVWKNEVFICLWSNCKHYGQPSCSYKWLVKHVTRHCDVRPFKCVINGCDMAFPTQNGLARHVPSHFNEGKVRRSCAQQLDLAPRLEPQSPETSFKHWRKQKISSAEAKNVVAENEVDEKDDSLSKSIRRSKFKKFIQRKRTSTNDDPIDAATYQLIRKRITDVPVAESEIGFRRNVVPLHHESMDFFGQWTEYGVVDYAFAAIFCNNGVMQNERGRDMEEHGIITISRLKISLVIGKRRLLSGATEMLVKTYPTLVDETRWVKENRSTKKALEVTNINIRCLSHYQQVQLYDEETKGSRRRTSGRKVKAYDTST